MMERVVLTCVLTICLINLSKRTLSQKLDINAFEYTRKIKHKLEIGQCVSTHQEIFPGSLEVKRCSLPPKTEPIKFLSKELNDTRTFEVQGYNDVFVCMGLCDGQAAAALGLLKSGDCFAVEIAGRLTFSKKTYIQAYVEYYRNGIDIQQTEGIPPLALQHYFDGNYFLHDRSYGTMEIIILELRFSKQKQAEALRTSRKQTPQLSSFLQHIVNEVGIPSSMKVFRLSSAKEMFDLSFYKSKDLNMLFQRLLQYESDIFHVREDIKRGYLRPHLRYGMFPYTHPHTKIGPGSTISPPETSSAHPMLADMPADAGCTTGTSLRSSDHIDWEAACVVEVKLNTALQRNKRLRKKCRKFRVEECKNLSKIRKGLKKLKADVHTKRSKWHQLNDTQKKKVKTVNKEIKTFSKELSVISNKMRELKRMKRKNKRKKEGNK